MPVNWCFLFDCAKFPLAITTLCRAAFFTKNAVHGIEKRKKKIIISNLS